MVAIALIVLMGITLLVLLSGSALYARLIKLRTAVTSAQSEIDTAINKRDDPLPGTPPGQLRDIIAAAAGDYNAAVNRYNSAIDTFPADLLAKCFSLKKAEFFDP